MIRRSSRVRKNSLAFLLTCLVVLLGQAQPSAISLFASDSIVDVFLHTDMRSLLKSKFTETEQPAYVQIVHSPGDTSAYAVEIRCRGNIRKEVCYYPSIRMKFTKEDFSYNKLKWVNVCDGDLDKSDLLKEFLAYQLYHLITDKSFQTYLARIHYIDSLGKEKPFDSYAFVIQNADELAAQYGGRVYEPTILKKNLLNPAQTAIFTFFQYMIGNTDWAFGNRHNIEIFTDPETNSLIPVAYDFDYSGLVNTDYAVPHESMPIKYVRIRHNKSVCMDEELCEKTRILFLDKKEAVVSYCSAFAFLDSKVRKKTIKYLEDFFAFLEDPKNTRRIFVRDCNPMD